MARYEYSYDLTERFLNLYRQLESFRGGNPKAYEFYKRKYADDLNLFRELRNYLSHEEYGGSYPFAISEAIVISLEKILKEMNLTCERAMKKNVIVATNENSLSRVIETMKANRLTYVPIVDEKKKVTGMISSESIIAILAEGQNFTDKKVSDYLEYFSLSDQSKKFTFLGRRDSFSLAEKEYSALSEGKRVGIILVTENGSNKESLLGIISPYDVFEKGSR